MVGWVKLLLSPYNACVYTVKVYNNKEIRDFCFSFVRSRAIILHENTLQGSGDAIKNTLKAALAQWANGACSIATQPNTPSNGKMLALLGKSSCQEESGIFICFLFFSRHSPSAHWLSHINNVFICLFVCVICFPFCHSNSVLTLVI